jgi:hypothetical protein
VVGEKMGGDGDWSIGTDGGEDWWDSEGGDRMSDGIVGEEIGGG